jgi:hypothetical protein
VFLGEVGFMVSIRLWAGGILLLLLSALLYLPAASQSIPDVQKDAGFRFLSKEEGEAVVWVAWELRRGLGSKPDCSHFVNLVYTRAGLDYEYANTEAIFEGIEAFRRVPDPQPGDLVAWKGHVGLVVDPEEHSFYSSVRSGFAIENYRSDYWTNWGRPRFYRYVIDDIHSARLAAHLKAIPQVLPPPSVSSSQLADTYPDLNSSNRPSAHNETIPKPSGGDSEISDVLFVSSHARPSNDEIGAAMLHLADANRDSLSVASMHAVVVVETLRVDRLSLNDHFGWAELVAEENASSRCSPSGLTRRGARWRVTLRREERGWILLVPRDHIYLRREVATRSLGHRPASDATRPGERPDDQTSCSSAQ